MSIEAINTAPGELVAKVTQLKNDGWRLVTFTSVELNETDMEVLYHFDKDLKLTNLRVPVKKGGTLPSVSGVLFAAFLIENEIRDQFGLVFEGLVLDFGGKLYLDDEAERTPFCKFAVTRKEKA